MRLIFSSAALTASIVSAVTIELTDHTDVVSAMKYKMQQYAFPSDTQQHGYGNGFNGPYDYPAMPTYPTEYNPDYVHPLLP